MEEEADKQSEYELDVRGKLEEMRKPEPVESKLSVKRSYYSDLKLPNLTCDTFSGEGTCHGEYFAFITKFNNVIGMRESLPPSVKFTYLKSFLKGYALKLIEHLSISDQNYEVALTLLEGEFLYRSGLVDD